MTQVSVNGGQLGAGLPNDKSINKADRFFVSDHRGEFYSTILERIHAVLRPKTYFEIGTLYGSTLALSKCASLAVDPHFQLNCDVMGEKPICLMFQLTSDEFFARHDPTVFLGDKIDFAFLDGLHLFEFLLRDFMNVEPHCKKDSIIALHDCIPTDIYVARRNPEQRVEWQSPPHPEWWTGDVWKVPVILKRFRPDLRIYAFDSAPTGLVLITNLDPNNTTLKQSYDAIVDELKNTNLTDFGLAKFYSGISLTSTGVIGDADAVARLLSSFSASTECDTGRSAAGSNFSIVGVLSPTSQPLLLKAEWADFASLLSCDIAEDGRFLHAPEQLVETAPIGMVPGVNNFGPGYIPSIQAAPNGASITRRIESFLLNNATLVPHSMTILDKDEQIVSAAMENINRNVLASYDPNYFLDESGTLTLSPTYFQTREEIDIIAAPVCGPGFPNYGHFIYDGLPGVILHRQLLSVDLRIVGLPLRDWQAQILDALGLLSSYVPVERPTRFRKVLGTTMLSLHLSYPSRFIRNLFDLIRFRFGAQDGPKRNIFISRGTDSSKRVLRNRAEVEATAARLGFDVVCMDQLSFKEQVRLMASARVVAGEAGAGFANIGFCDPGAAILEILPMPDPWTRGACFQLGHRWLGFFPLIDEARPENMAPGVVMFGQDFSYSVDCAEFAAALKTLTLDGE